MPVIQTSSSNPTSLCWTARVANIQLHNQKPEHRKTVKDDPLSVGIVIHEAMLDSPLECIPWCLGGSNADVSGDTRGILVNWTRAPRRTAALPYCRSAAGQDRKRDQRMLPLDRLVVR
jgi:hypothetical protein